MMQSLLRSVCRAGIRGTAAKLLDCAVPGGALSGVNQSAIKPLRPYRWIRPIGVRVRVGDRVVGLCVCDPV